MEKNGKPPNQLYEFVKQVNYKEFGCGWGAAFINIIITYPLNKVIFRQMLHGVKVFPAAKQIYHEGFYFLYRGILPPLCQKTLSVSIMFGVYEECRRPLVEHGYNVYMAKTIGGIVAGSTEAILTPFERIQTLLSDSNHHERFRNMTHAFRTIGLEYGFREYYRGLVPILLRNGPSNAMFFILRDEMQERLPKTHSFLNDSARDFISGALIGVFLSCIFYPLNVIKVATQSTIGGKHENSVTIMKHIYHERGFRIRNIYHGVSTNCTRAFFSWGVMNTAYTNLKELIY